MKFHTSRLDELHDDMNSCGGNPHDPKIIAKYEHMELAYDTIVNEDLSPFSRQYFDQQLALYTEISGRKLNQEAGELHPFEEGRLLDSPNPIGLLDAAEIAAHVRSLATMLGLASLSGRPRVLDMGAGHGLSSEVFAFAGCRVHAVDIDPGLARVSRERARRRNLDIVRSDMNFDDISAIEDDNFDAAFFFQSLHHCLRPWNLIEQLQKKLHREAVIAFAGEPLQTYWWKNWGLRLDRESLFVARGHGWFESGFSHAFIRECFERNGMTLLFFSGGHHGGEIGVGSRSPEKLAQICDTAKSIGLRLIEQSDPTLVDDSRFASLCGSRQNVFGRPGFVQREGETGVLQYGPYIDLQAGRYRMSLIIGALQDGGRAKLDVASDLGNRVIFEEFFDSSNVKPATLIIRDFDILADARHVEIRTHVNGECGWSASNPTITRVK